MPYFALTLSDGIFHSRHLVNVKDLPGFLPDDANDYAEDGFKFASNEEPAEQFAEVPKFMQGMLQKRWLADRLMTEAVKRRVHWEV